MRFGEQTDFAIEAYHEPYGPQYGGFGRISIDIQGIRIGDIRENHCSLFHTVRRFQELYPTVENLWDESFSGKSNIEIFAAIDHALYLGEKSEWERFGRFDFLTNAGEPFDGFKTFIICRPNERVHILFRGPDMAFGAGTCGVQPFRHVAESFVRWFDEQVRNMAPPYFPINPFDLNEKVPDDWP